MDSKKLKVIFIAGAGRSGTTLFSRILGQVPGLFSAGELMWIWPAGFGRNQLCSCGARLRECKVWSEVFRRGFGEMSEQKIDSFSELLLKVGTRKNLHRLLMPTFQGVDYKRNLSDLGAIYERLFQTIMSVTNSEIVIDSSKDPSHALFLRHLPETSVFTVHLVRDSRAVAYSRTRVKKKTSIDWKEELMPIESPVMSSAKWAMNNYLNEWIGSKDNYMRVRYEDFVNEPRKVLTEVLEAIGFEHKPLNFIKEPMVQLDAHHTALGNPGKSKRGAIHLKADIEWKTNMSPGKRRIVTALTLPQLRRFHYL